MPFASSPRSALLTSATLLLVGCARPLPPAEYRAYLADSEHGLTHTREVNGATITCSYRPTELLVLQELAGMPTASTTLIDSLVRAYAGKTYCALSFSRNGSEIENQLVNNPAAYEQALAYLNTGIAADTYLRTSGRDSVQAMASMYLRQYGTTGRSTVVLVFPTPQRKATQRFDLTFLGRKLDLSTQRFAFQASDLAALPPLQYP